jgi:hypothetical protein
LKTFSRSPINPPGNNSEVLKLIREISNIQGLIVNRLTELERKYETIDNSLVMLMNDLTECFKQECIEELGRVEIV